MKRPSESTSQRKPYLDWARGAAVLVMIQAHTLDAWTRTSERSSAWYRDLTILGGLAAPLFLWLAGLGSVLAAERAFDRTSSRTAAFRLAARRGLAILGLAFLFRLQAFVISPGSAPVALLRVDILNVMGPALMAIAIIWAIAPGWRLTSLAFAGVAMAIGMATPLIRTAHWVDALPVWAQWYLRPAGDHTTFTLFPWSGFAFGGAAVGALLARRGDLTEKHLHASLAATGATLIVVGWLTSLRPSIYPAASFWTSSPTYFAIRAGVLLVFVAALYTLQRVPLPSGPLGVLQRLGRHSLFVYWIHVELVYGYATWLIHRQLWLWQTVLAYVAFTALMYRAIRWRDHLESFWTARRHGRHTPQQQPV